LASQAGQDGLATDRLADLQDRMRIAEQRATEVREQIITLSRELVDAHEVGEVCSLFDPLWETLTAREQARILHLLIERVDYDGKNGTVSITFHPTGIKTLADELSRQEIDA
jgi:site-specific DNA recombinase